LRPANRFAICLCQPGVVAPPLSAGGQSKRTTSIIVHEMLTFVSSRERVVERKHRRNTKVFALDK